MKPKFIALAVLAISVQTPVSAATWTWDGGGGDDLFGTGANWSTNVAPSVGSGEILWFSGGTRTTPSNNYASGDNFGEWWLKNTATADFTISGNLFGLFGKIENETGSNRTFTLNNSGIAARDSAIEINPVGGNIVLGASNNVFLDGNARLDVYDGNNNRSLTINGALDNGNGTGGNGSLVLNQTSTVILAGTNDYGSTTINTGTTLRIGAGGTTGTLGTGNVSNSGSLVFNRSNALAVGNAISGAGTIFQAGGGTTTLSATSGGFTGTVNVSAGRLIHTNSGTFGTLAALNLTGTGAFEAQANATVTAAINLSAGELRLSPTTTANVALTSTGGITVGTGGSLVLAANVDGSTQRTSAVTGNVSVSGGTLTVSPSTLTTSANQRSISGTLAMSSGTLSLDTGTAAQTRLSANGLNITGGAINTGSGTGNSAQLVSIGASNTLNATSFDKQRVAVSLQGTNQSLSFSNALGEVFLRNTGGIGTTTTKTLTATGGGTLGKLTFGAANANSVSNLVLGSNLTTTNDPASSSMPNGGFGSAGNLVSFGIDTAGFTLDMTASRGSGASSVWTPNVVGGTGSTTNWSITNSGTAGQGGLKANSVSFSTATQVNLGAGAVLDLVNGATTPIVSDLGGGGTVSSSSVIRYANTDTSGSAIAHTFNSNRNLGHVEIRAGHLNHELNLENDATWSVAGQLRAVQGKVIANQTNKLGSSIVFSAADAPAGTNASVTYSSVTLNVISSSSPVSYGGLLDMTAMPALHQGRSEFRLRGESGNTATLTLSGGVNLATTGSGSYRVSFGAERPGQTLDLTGAVNGGAGVATVLVNGSNTGTGTVRLSNSTSNFSSAITIVNGTLAVAHTNALGTGTFISMADGGTPNSGATVRLIAENGVAVSRNIQLSSSSAGGTATYVVGGSGAGASSFTGNITSASSSFHRSLELNADASGTVTFSGLISDNAGTGTTPVTKTGAGTVLLNRAGGNTYDGNTVVSAGTLIVDNTSGSATGSGNVTVNSSTTLGGSGSISGAVSVAGLLSPGNSPGILSTGDLSFTGTGSLLAEMNRGLGLSLVPGSDYDQVNVTGTIDLSAGPALALAALGTGSWTVGQMFFLLRNDSTDAINGTFSGLADGGVFSFDGAQFKASYSADSTTNSFTGGNDFALQVIPEPGTAAIAALLASGMLMRRRRA